MDNLNFVIAENLKKLRVKRKLSLENVAKITGVSKSMIGQIERGEVNPTVSTVWKISNGFKISFTELMSRPETEIEIVGKPEIQPLVEDNGQFRNFPMFSFDSKRRFEMFSVEIDSGSRLDAEAHPDGTQEFITVFSGEVSININNENHIVSKDHSIRFKADTSHTYENTGNELCTLCMVIYYPL